MPSNICALTGEIIKEAAVSKKTGHIYEKSAIVKHLSSFPYCPVTNVGMSLQDLIEIKGKLIIIQGSKEQVRHSQQSAGTFLNSLREEYDTLVLQTFYLRKNIKKTKEQLCHSLAANEASENVIGRLLREKQQLDREISKLQTQLRV